MNSGLNIAGILLSAVLGLSATLIGGLVLYNLKNLKCYIEKLNKRMDSLEAEHKKRMDSLEAEHKQFALRKAVCQQEFVPIGQFLRESGYTRKRLDDAIEAVKGLTGKLDVIGQLPQIAGQIASQTVKEMMSLMGKG